MFPHFPPRGRRIRDIAACLGVLTAALAMGASMTALSGDAGKDSVKAIAFAKGALDHKHSFYWRGWSIAFSATPPQRASSDRGMEIRGLRCGQPGAKQLGCHLLMVMAPEESKPHYCEILPDSARAEGPWPLLIACPSKISWVHKAS